jgi:subtilase family serine protease
MKLAVTSRPALVAAALLLLAYGSPALAGIQRPGAIRMDRAEATPDAKAVFGCELRKFDRNLNPNRGVACYGPSAIRAAYAVQSLLDAGFDGTGRTIVILDAFGSPTALSDLQAFDTVFGVPDPPSFQVITMPGTPAFDPNDGNVVGWAEETSLDVQWSHAIAPGANIVLVAAKSNNDDDLIDALDFIVDSRLGDVVSMSFGESEAFLTDADGQRVVARWEAAFKRATERKMTLFVSSGDQGSTNTADGAGDVFPFQNVSYPASSPQVTGVGGTNLFFGVGDHADPNGAYIGEKVWNDEPQGIAAAGGGGVSALFREPNFQRDSLSKALQDELNGMRGVPDVAYNGGVVGGVIVHLSEAIIGIPNGAFFIFGGTSAGAPQWAGVIADVNQIQGKPSGSINDRLYKLGKKGVNAGLFHDVTTGDNGFCFFTVPDGAFQCVPGFSGTPGFDLATGWGTPNFGTLGTLLTN